MSEFLSSSWGIVVVIGAGLTTLWNIFKSTGATRRWVKDRVDDVKKKRRKSVLDASQEIISKVNDLSVQMESMGTSIKGIESQITTIKDNLAENDEATATIMLQKMMSAYHKYVLCGDEIPLDVQTSLAVMFDQYTKNKKHNHIPYDFKERILACKVMGQK